MLCCVIQDVPGDGMIAAVDGVTQSVAQANLLFLKILHEKTITYLNYWDPHEKNRTFKPVMPYGPCHSGSHRT